MQSTEESRSLAVERSQQPLRAVVSVHDVMPETLPNTMDILKRLRAFGVSSITALVVPGRNWRAKQIDWLREQQREGLTIAGHGWYHRVQKRQSLYHKLHGLLISRMVAEHLSLEEAEIAELISRCYQWFEAYGFDGPTVYVPPAWAMGSIRNSTLDTLPFELYENLTGVYRAGHGSFARLPLAGYEADDPLRVSFLRGWNRFNELRARRTGRPVRITLHPRDFTLGLAGQIEAQIQRVDSFLDYRQAWAAAT